jgi:hypothetical protein
MAKQVGDKRARDNHKRREPVAFTTGGYERPIADKHRELNGAGPSKTKQSKSQENRHTHANTVALLASWPELGARFGESFTLDARHTARQRRQQQWSEEYHD